MNRSLLFVANWKMELLPEAAIEYARMSAEKLNIFAKNTRHTFVLCPSNLAIPVVLRSCQGQSIKIGAQNCSRYESGPFTGEESAAALGSIGCSYCIVGHSDRRHYFCESDNDVMQKIKWLIKAHIIPVLCIGQIDEQSDIRETMKVLSTQLDSLKNICAGHGNDIAIYIAYEPVWAIGSNRVPEGYFLKKLYRALMTYLTLLVPPGCTLKVLYGGSVNEESIVNLNQLGIFDGFLIGRASLDFQTFKNLIELCS